MRGLRLPKDLVISASGIGKNIIDDDIRQGILFADKNNDIWYHDALNYVAEKWNEGKTIMYDPLRDEGECSFAARVLSRIDDQISVGNLELIWKRR